MQLAVKWLRKAAENNHAEAQYILSQLYFEGDGVPMDEAEAQKWLQKSKENGYEPNTVEIF